MKRPTLLKLAIVQSGRTARDVAESAHISESTLSKYANGWHGNELTRQKIARALGRTPDELWPEPVESRAA